jgi:hypothetical protein
VNTDRVGFVIPCCDEIVVCDPAAELVVVIAFNVVVVVNGFTVVVVALAVVVKGENVDVIMDDSSDVSSSGIGTIVFPYSSKFK